ncbi:MAG: bifunctional D-glycero-beta-D-manno-heptose-7-phosphate kinase/D-glycero-beta-D-manno-heptose 1-phosphate adenylyltransferase HldE [Alphaproteobacteria bacterium]|nr:bifunctional D-glycero-beta-D-manno-heptose-7-phosphate kinase/D-glycero-beta-D-manno-heptose 1-phosphate adenylyltransferase HldE [Alphaproteobacteria bacterium]
MNPLEALSPFVPAFVNAKVLCVGDLMLDRYVYGSVERISPEAPIPVLSVEREIAMLGGAGNVARNVAALGGTLHLVAAVGADAAGREVEALLHAEPRLKTSLVRLMARPTTVKSRLVAGTQQIVRADREDSSPLSPGESKAVISAALRALADVQVVILSDYAKGVLSPDITATLIAAAREAKVPVIVDPKSSDFARYHGANLLTPNARELAIASGLPVGSDAAAAGAAQSILARVDIDAILVTRSEHGMTLVQRGAAPIHLSAHAREIADVSGAGDTVLASLGLAVAAGASLAEAARLANHAAGIVVGKVGTATVHPDELLDALQAERLRGSDTKTRSRGALLDLVAQWRARGLTIGFTNGCFDLLHPGHVSLLAQAKANCDRLIVGLNDDASVRRLKGPSRPINGETARATVLGSLQSVDAVTLFAEDTPLALIEAIRPDVLVKGADYTIDKVVGADFVQSYGGRVVLAALTEGQSTTATIARMQP